MAGIKYEEKLKNKNLKDFLDEEVVEWKNT